VNCRSSINPPLKKGEIGGFALGRFGKIPPHPPLQRGEYYLRISSKSLGMVRQFQQSYFSDRYPSTYWGYYAPDFAHLANAYRIESQTVTDYQSLPLALEKMWENPQAPFLLQVFVDVWKNAYPKIAFGHPMTEMEPFAKPLKMEGT